MKKQLVVGVALASIGISGCSTYSSSVPSSEINTQTVAQVQADLNISTKISGKCSMTKILFFTLGDGDKQAKGVFLNDNNSSYIESMFEGQDPVKQCARSAAYDAVTSSGSDIIYAPRYVSKTWSIPFIYEQIDVDLVGYKATIQDFKQLNSQTIWQFTGKR